MQPRILVAALLALSRCACPNPPVSDDAGPSAGRHDAGDSGVTSNDAGDAGHDAGDAGHDAGDAGHDAGDAGHDAGDAGHDAGDAGHDAGNSGPDAGNVVPGCSAEDALCVVLTWDSDRGDLDLHLTQAGEETCSTYGCYFGNCTLPDPSVDFDDSGGPSTGDPVLVDDTFGLGPETVRLRSAVFGAQLFVGVFSQPPSTNPSTTASVVVASYGQEVARYTQTLAPNTFWNVARVTLGAPATATAASGPCAEGAWICTAPAGACQ